MFTFPHVVAFQAVKVGDDVMCVYSVAMFDFKEGCGYFEFVTVCHFINSLFRDLGSVKLGFVSEEEFEQGEEIELGAVYS